MPQLVRCVSVMGFLSSFLQVEVGKVLGIPLIVTEQYPRQLGKTVADIDISKALLIVPKTRFSMLVPEVDRLLHTLCDGILESIVLFGIEVTVNS